MNYIVEIFKQYGPLAGILAGVIYYFVRREMQRDKLREELDRQRDQRDQEREARDLEREQRLGSRIDVLEDFIKDELAKISRDSTAALNSQAESNRQLAESNRALADSNRSLREALLAKPCFECETSKEPHHATNPQTAFTGVNWPAAAAPGMPAVGAAPTA